MCHFLQWEDCAYKYIYIIGILYSKLKKVKILFNMNLLNDCDKKRSVDISCKERIRKILTQSRQGLRRKHALREQSFSEVSWNKTFIEILMIKIWVVMFNFVLCFRNIIMGTEWCLIVAVSVRIIFPAAMSHKSVKRQSRDQYDSWNFRKYSGSMLQSVPVHTNIYSELFLLLK